MLSDIFQVENKLAECQVAEYESHFATHFGAPAEQFLSRLDLESRIMRIKKL
jgi:hypothetical protein